VPLTLKVQHTLQNIQADSPQLVNIRMVDLGKKANLWRCHGIIIGQKELKFENATCALLEYRESRLCYSRFEPSYGD
jgi:hypothetical protein